MVIGIAWNAGAVRARLLAQRRLGAEGSRELARRGSLDDALADLQAGPYAHDLDHHETTRELDARSRPGRPASERVAEGIRSVLDRVVAIAGDAGADAATELLEGDPLRAIMRDARNWQPDLVLIGRPGRSGPGSPMVGSLAMHLIEFAEWPVVVVPETGRVTREGDRP